MIITFTGHRPDKILDVKECSQKLLVCMERMGVDFQNDFFKVGGCPGFDTIALKLLVFKNVPIKNIEILVPFEGFEKYATRDPLINQMVYEFNCKLKKEGYVLKSVGGIGSFGQKCFRRNEKLVNGSSIIFTNWDGSAGGTANTVKLAKDLGLTIVNILKKD
jgi:hypothetical protein